MIFYNFVIVDRGLLAGVVYKYGDQQRDYDANHLCLHGGLLFAVVQENNGRLDIDVSFGKFDLLQLELFHFLLFTKLFYTIPSSLIYVILSCYSFYSMVFYFFLFLFFPLITFQKIHNH